MAEVVGELGRLGLLIDIAGAVLVAKAVFWVKDKDIFDTSAGFLGYSTYHTVEGIAAKYEAIVGTSLLMLGFFGQYLATTIGSNGEVNNEIDLIFAICCAFIVLLTVHFAKVYAKRKTAKFVKEFKEKE